MLNGRIPVLPFLCLILEVVYWVNIFPPRKKTHILLLSCMVVSLVKTYEYTTWPAVI